jgi:hypothetical protein
LRVVFLKQCFAWMVHGELEDPGLEFFIQARHHNKEQGRSAGDGAPLQDKVLHALFQASRSTTSPAASQHRAHTTGETPMFDWTSSYSLSLDKIPSSHISPRIASKIVFAGKAVKLLHTSGALQTSEASRHPTGSKGAEYHQTEAYRYLSSGASNEVAASEQTDSESEPEGDSQASKRPTLSKAATGAQEAAAMSVEDQVRSAFGEYVASGGYSVQDTQRFSELFSAVLAQPDRAVELLETAVEAVNDCISNRLWVLLRDSYGFNSFLQVIRSTYLLGRGELFQSLLDGILQQTYSAPPETLEMDNILNWRILRSSAKLVGLENDDSLNDMLTLKVSSASLNIRNFAMHRQDIALVGAAVEVAAARLHNADSANLGGGGGEAPRLGQRTLVELCKPRPSTSQQQFEEIWTTFIRKRAVARNTNGEWYTDASADESLVDSLDAVSVQAPDGGVLPADAAAQEVSYCTGAVWLSDPKPVSKGFDWSATFACAWTEARAQVHPAHVLFQTADSTSSGTSWNPFAKRGGRVVALGSVSCHLRGDRKSNTAPLASRSPLPAGSPGSLVVGVTFYGKYRDLLRAKLQTSRMGVS